MIPFREVTLSDKPLIDSLICADGCHGADYNFANIFIWRKMYKPLIHITEGLLLVAMPESNLYSYPMGDGDIKTAIEMYREDAHARGHSLTVRGLTEETIKTFQAIYGDSFEYIEDRDTADYIYSAEKLRYLAGRKLGSKRNHIKHFEKNGEWELRRLGGDFLAEGLDLVDSDGKSIGKADFADARRVIDAFYKEKDDPDFEDEAFAVGEMFAHFDELGFIGAVLYQNGESVGFTAGTHLSSCGYDVHFEKALGGVDGAYTMINREFVNMLCQIYPELKMINREEDLGIEGLRKAKLSYKPDVLLMKYIAKERING